MSNALNIFLVGEVSAGKSSLLNALAGGFISNSSIQRETIYPEIYQFISDKDGKAYPSLKRIAGQLEKKHLKNKTFSSNKEKIIEEIDKPKIVVDIDGKPIIFKSQFSMGDFTINDFPGLNDADDSKGVFFNLVADNIMNCDCLIHVTKAETAFISQSEVNIFKRLVELCETRKINYGQHIEICIVVNKFDDCYNPDLVQISNQIHKKLDMDNIPIYRLSSHRLLVENIIKHKLYVPVPKFMRPELETIFRNANVITTKEQKSSIVNQNKIAHKHIIFNENIDCEECSPCKKTDQRNKSDSDTDDGSDSDTNDGSDSDADDGSDFDDKMNDDTTMEKPEYNYDFEGDWNNLISFIKNEKVNNPQKKDTIRHEWLNKFFTVFDKINFGYSGTAKQSLVNFHKIYSTFLEKNDLDYFVKMTCQLISKIFKNEVSLSTLLEYLFSGNFKFSPAHITQICAAIMKEITINISNSSLQIHHIYYAIIVMEKFRYYREDDILKILQNKIIWDYARSFQYCDFNKYTIKSISNNSAGKYRTQWVERIYKSLDKMHVISFLIELSLVEPEYLPVLHSNNKIPYQIITKYLGEKASNRLIFKIHYNFGYGPKGIPLLFDNDPSERINNTVNKYLEIEKMIDSYKGKIYKAPSSN